MSYINSLFASFAQHPVSTYSVNRKSDIKSGIIELNKIKIRVTAGDTLQRICNKINSKTTLHGVTAKLARERSHTVISLSSPRQIDILDRNNILNNIGTRIRANVVRSSLVDGLISTSLAEHKKVSPRYIVSPYQICEAPINNAASDDYEEEYEAPGNPYAASEKIVLENEQVIVEEKPSLPISAIQEHSNKEWISRLYNIGYNPSMNFAHKLAAFNAHTKKHANVLHAYEQGNEIMRFLT